MARHGDETEEFPQWAWDGMRKAELFGITIGERWGGAGLGDIEAAIVLEELARADVSSAILAQLIFNGPPRAIEHLGSDALRDRWLPIAASGEGLFCIGISETEAGQRGRPHAGQPHPRRRRLPAQRVQELRDRRAQGAGVPRVVPLPRQRGHEGHRRGRRRPRSAGRHRRRHAREDGAARRRAKPSSRSTTCASSPKTCSCGATPRTASRSRR